MSNPYDNTNGTEDVTFVFNDPNNVLIKESSDSKIAVTVIAFDSTTT